MHQRYYEYRTAASTYNSDAVQGAIDLGFWFIGLTPIFKFLRGRQERKFQAESAALHASLMRQYGADHRDFSDIRPEGESCFVKFDDDGLPVSGVSQAIL